MKKILFLLLLLPALVFGQATGLIISNKPTGGAIGTAATTVDVATLFNVNQTTAGQTLTVPNLTNASAGKIIYINDVGSASFTLSPGGLLSSGTGTVLRWTGAAWNVCGLGSGGGGGGGGGDSINGTPHYIALFDRTHHIVSSYIYQGTDTIFILDNKTISSQNGHSFLQFTDGSGAKFGYDNGGSIDGNLLFNDEKVDLEWHNGGNRGKFKSDTNAVTVSHTKELILDAPIINFPNATSAIPVINNSKNLDTLIVGTGLSYNYSTKTLTSTGSGGTVTSVTGTPPIVSSGGATPAISADTTKAHGKLATYDDVRVKGTGSVTSVATGYGLSGGTITTSGTLLSDTTKKATDALTGYLSYADHQTFNNKQATITATPPLYISSNVISSHKASVSDSGYVSTGTQTFKGNKTIAGSLTDSSSTIQGTYGNGFLELKTQLTNPAAPSSGTRIFSNSNSKFSWRGSANNYVKTFDGSAATADRVYSLPNHNGNVVTTGDTATVTPLMTTSSLYTGSFGVTYDGMGGVITTNNYTSVTIPYAGTITKWYVSSIDPSTGSALSGSIVVDIKRSGTSIIGAGNKPTLTSASSANATISSWTSTSVSANDELIFYVSSVTTCVKVIITIIITKT